MGRQSVTVQLGHHDAVSREPGCAVTLAVGMPANERMDWLVEKATELGVDAIRPLVTERSVLRLDGERAERKRQHWQAVAVAAAEQCGRTRVPLVHPVRALTAHDALPAAAEDAQGWVLSLGPDALAASTLCGKPGRHWLLSGPEGGLSDAELARADGAVVVGVAVPQAGIDGVALVGLQVAVVVDPVAILGRSGIHRRLQVAAVAAA